MYTPFKEWMGIASVVWITCFIPSWSSSVSPVPVITKSLPGPTLRELAEDRGLLFGTDIMDLWPYPYSTNLAYKTIAQQQFNFGNWDWCTTWSMNQPKGPEQPYDFSCFDGVVPFMKDGNMSARTNAIIPNAHNILPPVATNLPVWLTSGHLNGSFSKKQIQKFLHDRIETVVPHWLKSGLPFKGMITANEAFWNQEQSGSWPSNWIYGSEQNVFSWAFDNDTEWFPQTFNWTREVTDALGFNRTQVPLFYSDYGITTFTKKADAVLRFMKEQLAAGTPIDGIGFQSHLTCDCAEQAGCNNASVIEANMRRFINLGLSVWITELDVRMAPGCTQQMQADVYGAVLEACLNTAPHCNSFMVWGFTDLYTWLDNVTQAPNLLDAEFQPKPAFFALQKKLGG